MRKCDELRCQTSCLNKAAADEPVFVIRAKDPLAAQIVRLWADMAEDVHERDKINDALDAADQIESWQQNQVTCSPETPFDGPKSMVEKPRLRR